MHIPELGLTTLRSVSVRPTVKHLTAYRKWASTEKQTMEWLGNSADEVYKVVVKPGATAFIPAGWIHAVVRPPSLPLIRMS